MDYKISITVFCLVLFVCFVKMATQENINEREPWTEDILKEAMRKIDSGEIAINEVESIYGIPARVVYRQKAKG